MIADGILTFFLRSALVLPAGKLSGRHGRETGPMDGSGQQPMDGGAGTRSALAVPERDEIQAARPVCEGPDAGGPSEELRARLIAATLELVAEGASDPGLVDTRSTRTAA